MASKKQLKRASMASSSMAPPPPPSMPSKKQLKEVSMAASSSSSSSTGKMISLKTSDDEDFVEKESVACQCKTIQRLIEDIGHTNSTIPLSNVDSRIFTKIIEYCKKHDVDAVDDANDLNFEDDNNQTDTAAAASTSTAAAVAKKKKVEEALKKWDKKFLQRMEQDNTLFDVLLAANYLDLRSLLDLICDYIADKMKKSTVEEVRKMFEIENDLTAEEEEEIRSEHPWVYT